MTVLQVAFRLLSACILCFVVMVILMGFGETAGEALGLEKRHNAAQVAAAFLTGACITLMYKDRSLLPWKGEKSGK